MSTTHDESALLRSLFQGIDQREDRSRLIDLLSADREDSGARLAPRRVGGSRRDVEPRSGASRDGGDGRRQP